MKEIFLAFILLALASNTNAHADLDTNLQQPKESFLEETPVAGQTDYEGTYYGNTFETKDYYVCVREADAIQKKILDSGLQVIESACTSTSSKRWIVAVRYRYPFGRGIEEFLIAYPSIEHCEAERSKVQDILEFSEVKVIDIWCVSRDRQPQLRIDHIPHRQVRIQNEVVNNGQTDPDKCLDDAWKLDKYLNDLGIQAIHFHCEKTHYGIDLDPSYRISFAFLTQLGKRVSQIQAEKFSSLTTCQSDPEDKIKNSFQAVNLDLVYIGCEKRGRIYHRILYHFDDYTERSQKYVGLNVPSRRDCDAKLAELEALWEAQDQKAFYSFCQETGSGFYPILYSIRKPIEIDASYPEL